MKLIPTIGLEIHSELLTESKIFCGCSVGFGGKPNSRSCPGCASIPGTLPLLNKKAVEFIAKAGFATNCTISRFTKWDRKNYFYPDLPKAYQVSQLSRPVCIGGHIELGDKTYRINRIHLEEDAGKLVHEGGKTLADYNRGSIPLIELVTEPDFHSAEEVKEFFERIRLIYVYAGICNGKLEQGCMRCDVNISLAPEDSDVLGTRAEIKNLNSLRSIARAIEYEIERQTEAILSGGKLIQETRRFDDATGETFSMRSKENAVDYRYFPDPDIPPIIFTEDELQSFKNSLPEMPDKRIERYETEYKIPSKDAQNLLNNPALAFYFDDALKAYSANPKGLASALLTDFTRGVNDSEEYTFENPPIKAVDFAKVYKCVEEGKIARLQYKEVLKLVFETGGDFNKIAEEKGYWIKEDNALVESTIEEILSANPKAVEQWNSGDKKVFGFLMGQCNSKLKGSATPQAIKTVLEKKLR